MNRVDCNLVLIGMPNAGKSTVGKAVSIKLGIPFLDTDALIFSKLGRKPSEIVAMEGIEYFLKAQEETILTIDCKNSVISTGGAVIYSEKAMAHLKKDGKIFFLNETLENIKKRFAKERLLARSGGKDLDSLFEERFPLYQKYSDYIIHCETKDENTIAFEIVKMIKY